MKNKIAVLSIFMLFAAGLKAQTGGPGQPEFMQFQQAGTSNLVNPSSGTFSYQVPLFKIGGYPVNLTYQAGIQMEDVSTYVGLGWALNLGSIVRTQRGLPDDFNGDVIIKQYSVKPNETYGGKVGVDLEIAGLPQPMGVNVGASLGVFYNNYKGWGLEPSLNGSVGVSAKANSGVGGTASLGMGISINSQSGVDKYLSPSVGLKLGKGNDKLAISLGKTWSVNSNEGLKTSMNVGLSYVRSSDVTRSGIKDGWKVSERATDQSSMSLLGLAVRSYLNNSFQPDIDYPFENSSGTYSGAFGFDGFYVDPSFRVTGYYSKQALATTTQQFPAYGAMYESAQVSTGGLMDISEEKKLPYFIGESKILPISFKTPDIFNLNAQGLSMSFSVSKNDIGLVGDAEAIINSNGTQGGAEVNLGELFKAGANFGTTTSFQKSGRWNPTNLAFKAGQDIIGNQLYQQFVFKNQGEINKFDYSAFAQLGGYSPVNFTLANASAITQSLSNGSQLTANVVNTNQAVRQSTISYLTAGEAAVIGFDKQLTYYSFSNNAPALLNRVSEYRRGHHLSEVSVIQPDGMKYIFGIPVYNKVQKEVNFAVGANAIIDQAKNLVKYMPGQENSAGNTKGIDHLFEATTTPAYVTQFLITAVLSPDYRDMTNDGITDDDLGNYVKFSYYKEESAYNWRTPFAENMATYNRGLRSDDQDDKGTYVYGEKELWYVRSVESKTEIAEFHYSKRDDGYGAAGENGGIDHGKFLRKLDSIVVYSLPDRRKNGNSATPIKTIHFDYGYSLCKNIDNGISATTGKLTLNRVSFTYERSRKGKFAPYVFGYGIRSLINTVNPPYDHRSVNRWGYYQDNGNNYSDILDSSPLSNVDFPYALQDTAAMNNNAYAWNLTDIYIPGNGKLKVDYEANDYGYIQDKTAGQMFMVTGLGDANTASITDNKFYYPLDPINPLNTGIKDRLYFKLSHPINNSNPAAAKQKLARAYIQDIKDGFLYYKFYVKLSGSGNYEYVTGYTKIRDYGVAADSNYAYIQLPTVAIDDENNIIKCNPILKAAFQYMRINRNALLFDNTALGTPATFAAFVSSLPSIVSQLGSQLAASAMGVNLFCQSQGYCQDVNLSKSFIRLYTPSKMKIAGGSRVKQISINDNWDAMTGNTHPGKSYTTTYDYTTTETDPVTNAKISVSSGVADYEPLVGGDEISLKQPIFYSDVKKLAPDNDYYVEEPVNESLFPGPHITYGKVTQITNPTSFDVGKTGKVVNEYFTAKDYPVKVNRTAIDEKRDKSNFNQFQPPFVAIDQQHDFATVSQGYSIELNNMSGLDKAMWVYNQNGDRVSGEVSEYFPDNDHFTLIDHRGNISKNKRLGLSVEYTVAGKKSYDHSVSTSYNANLNMAIFGIVPVPIVMPLFSQMTEEKQFQSIVFDKEIHRTGLLKSKTVYSQTASVKTENLAFDEVTGEALLTKAPNEFNDTLYSFKYPAWWMHDGMRPAYANAKLNVNITNLPAVKQFLNPGDELHSVSNGTRVWVQSAFAGTFVNETGLPQTLTTGTDYQLYNAASKNMLSDAAGKVVTWKYNPLSLGTKISFGQFNILNSSAIQYDDAAVAYCDSCATIMSRLGKNEFISGRRGNFKARQTWFYLADRTPGNLTTGITNIQVQGLFKTYSDFWQLSSNTATGWVPNFTNWEWKEKVNLVDVEGQALETEDRIGRKSANLLGYQNTLIAAQANNSGYNEAYFDGFEDYYCAFCPIKPDKTGQRGVLSGQTGMKRVKIVSGNVIISVAEAHTGKYSLQVPGWLSFTVVPPTNCKDRPGLSGKTVCTECTGGFYPAGNKKYIFSCWVKVNSQQPVLSCSDASVAISNISSAVTLRSEGPVIEGWQRVMGSFTTAANANLVTVRLNKGNGDTYFDDIRIFPANANMVSYVYDDVNLRHTYTLDENNYFSKNEYNNQGELIRTKRETEKGIITTKESNTSLAKVH
ncbi:hypothetical protein [Mucilaginibacter flavidus]|uniref:hypothetical protein n=1 Tax=Mucilaginibacter flavidus TaxID=2949309 RepID=UPI002091EDF5|nr:hypothetical protein [Mucilaginibacter flavidus]MCO5948100.1 hypothetical protein [Mucilaginibacter flavidus]